METGGHILTQFDEDLKELKSTVIAMGSNARTNIENSVRGLINREKPLLNQAIADDDEEDQLEIEVDRMGMAIIVKFRPLASDLRMVISSMKISSNLERISDHAVSIAKRARKILKHDEISGVISLEPLLDASLGALSMAVQSYSDGDQDLAVTVIEGENKIAKLYKQIARKFTKSLEADAGQERDYLDLVFIARYLDRVSGLATNIAEDVVFAQTSMDVRHADELPEELQS